MDSTESTTIGSTIVVGIIILILLLVLVAILYYIYSLPVATPYPRSPFNYGDTIQIIPAVLSQYKPLSSTSCPSSLANPCPNQYLVRNNCSTGTCPGSNICYQNSSPFSGNFGCALTFTGNKEDPNTRWILRQFYDDRNGDSNQSFTNGFGNRFYLQSATTSSLTVPQGRVTFNVFNNTLSCRESGDRSFPYININDGSNNCFANSMIIYIEPSTQPDLYYILFPSKFGLSTFCPLPIETPLQNWPNDGAMSIRPWAQYTPGTSTYYPWDSAGNLNSNGPLLNSLPQSSPCNIFQTAPFSTPEVMLFKITKV